MGTMNIAWGNAIDRATLTGGAWQPTLPRSNMQVRALSIPARTTSAAEAATQFTATFSGSLPTVSVICLIGHNLSMGAQWRITARNAGGSVSATTGWLSVWPEIPAGAMEWEDDNWWPGTPSADLAGYFRPLAIWTGGRELWPAASASENPASWQIEISDTSNAAGYVQIERVFMGAALAPYETYEWGGSLGYVTETDVTENAHAVEFFDERPLRRVMKFNLPGLTADEAWGAALLLQRVVSISGEVVVIPDIDDVQYSLQRSFYGRLKQLSPISENRPRRNAQSFEVIEVVA